jgi:hypothetical protein
MGELYSTHKENRNACRILLEKPGVYGKSDPHTGSETHPYPLFLDHGFHFSGTKCIVFEAEIRLLWK